MKFQTEGLLSKWGFGDGDCLGGLTFDNGLLYLRGLPLDVMQPEHAALCRVVEEHVVPVLDQDVETYRIFTGHNPIRAARVDGVEPQYPDDERITLTPVEVDVPDEVILDIAREEWAKVS